MAKTKQAELPQDWTRDPHTEIETHGIGDGFVLFEEIGQHLRGYLRTFFKTRHGLAVAVEVTQPPTASVYRTEDDGKRHKLEVKGGDLVNLSLSGVDLERKLGADLRDVEVGIIFRSLTPTKSGQMKQYRVVVFQTELPF